VTGVQTCALPIYGGGTRELPGKASVQLMTFKKNGEYSLSLKDVKLGDQVFFKKNGRVNHTAIVTEIDANGNIYITHATKNKGRPGSIKTEKLNADGSIPYWNNSFAGTGRPKLSQMISSKVHSETKKAVTSNQVATSNNTKEQFYEGGTLKEVIVTPKVEVN
jgi:plastocyanin